MACTRDTLYCIGIPMSAHSNIWHTVAHIWPVDYQHFFVVTYTNRIIIPDAPQWFNLGWSLNVSLPIWSKGDATMPHDYSIYEALFIHLDTAFETCSFGINTTASMRMYLIKNFGSNGHCWTYFHPLIGQPGHGPNRLVRTSPIMMWAKNHYFFDLPISNKHVKVDDAWELVQGTMIFQYSSYWHQVL